MEITWHGGTCLKINGKNASVVIDPKDDNKSLSANIVMNSVDDCVEIDSAERVFDWPGEYEMKDILINAFQAWTKPKTEDDSDDDSKSTLIFRFNMDGIKMCHLGELGHSLTSELVDKIGDVDVLFIKVGKESNLEKSKAVEIMEAIEPRIIIPVGGNGFLSDLTEMGVQMPELEDKLVIKSASSLPVEQMKYVVLNSI